MDYTYTEQHLDMEFSEILFFSSWEYAYPLITFFQAKGTIVGIILGEYDPCATILHSCKNQF